MSALQNKLGANLLVEFRRLQLLGCRRMREHLQLLAERNSEWQRRKIEEEEKETAASCTTLHISAAGRLVGAIAYNYRRCSLPTLSELNKFRVDSLFPHQYSTALKTL